MSELRNLTRKEYYSYSSGRGRDAAGYAVFRTSTSPVGLDLGSVVTTTAVDALIVHLNLEGFLLHSQLN